MALSKKVLESPNSRMLANTSSIQTVSPRRFIQYFWGVIVHPRATFEALAAEHTISWAITIAGLLVLQVWGNMLLHAVFGLDWLGTRPILSDPTYVGGYGHLQVQLANWVPLFAALIPLLSLFNMIIVAGIAQVLSKLWSGQATFEQMVNVLTYATGVPALAIAVPSEWLFTVPMDLLSGQRYWWAMAMQGAFGSTATILWNGFVVGVYSILQYVWAIALGSIAIWRVQKIPAWAAVLTMSVSFAAWIVVWSTFVR